MLVETQQSFRLPASMVWNSNEPISQQGKKGAFINAALEQQP
jgi:hypothetical protein